MHARDTARLATPIGPIEVSGDEGTLHSLRILTEGDPVPASAASVRLAVEQLEQYFAGERREFDLPLTPLRSPRGPAMRDAIRAIGYAETRSHGEVAAAIGSSARAIGQACRTNAYPIIVPCHRVLAAGGTDNYSAGDGLPTKHRLLALERRHRRR
ncbi:MAG TPA: methylated-DNA--[protein]-cysteine S-methyltransferase [Sphingomonas sp.]|jgi:methylated-DNA-[protein]-cysteine S-methyltransferase